MIVDELCEPILSNGFIHLSLNSKNKNHIDIYSLVWVDHLFFMNEI